MKTRTFFLSALALLGCISKHNIFASNNVKNSSCVEIIQTAEKHFAIPDGILGAIAMVESGQKPWAVNSNGRSKICRNKGIALQYIKQLRAKGYRNINIACMQINYLHHRSSINIENMLDPYQNVMYAAKYLIKLKNRYGNWSEAIKYYHSPDPYHHNKYYSKVIALCNNLNNTSSPNTISNSTNNNKLIINTHKKQRFIIGLGPAVGFSTKKK